MTGVLMKAIEILNNNVGENGIIYWEGLNFKTSVHGDESILTTKAGVWKTLLSEEEKTWINREDLPANLTGSITLDSDGFSSIARLAIDDLDNKYLSQESQDARKEHPDWFIVFHLNLVQINKDWKPVWSNSAGSDMFQLDTGKLYIKHYGKYTSGLGIIVDPLDLSIVNPLKGYIKLFRETMKKSDLNLGDGTLDVMRGTFFTSKKGTKIFRVEADGKHLFLRDDWGGCFNSYRGGKLPKESDGALYYRRASSNGGGSGYDYAIVPVGWTNVLSEDDL